MSDAEKTADAADLLAKSAESGTESAPDASTLATGQGNDTIDLGGQTADPAAAEAPKAPAPEPKPPEITLAAITPPAKPTRSRAKKKAADPVHLVMQTSRVLGPDGKNVARDRVVLAAPRQVDWLTSGEVPMARAATEADVAKAEAGHGVVDLTSLDTDPADEA